MAGGFDPDAFLAEGSAPSSAPSGGFDPDAFLRAETPSVSAPSRESSAPQWLKSFSSNFDPESRLAPLAALPEMYDIGKQSLHSLYEAPGKLAASFSTPGSKTPGQLPGSDAFQDQRESIKRQAMEQFGKSEADAENTANIAIQRMQRGEALQSILFGAAGLLLSPALGAYRKFVSQPLEEAGGPPRDVTEGATMVGLAGAGLRPGMNALRQALGRPLEGDVLPPASSGPRPGVGPRPGGPIIEGEWSSPMTAREGTPARLLPPEYSGRAATGDPHYDAAWQALAPRSAGAAGRPGGPLADMDPAAINIARDILKSEGWTLHELDRLGNEWSPHGFFGEMSDALRGEVRSLHSLKGEAGNIIAQAGRQRKHERPDRMRGYVKEAFGDLPDPRVEKAERQRAEEDARPFWKEFDRTPIPPTEELTGLEGALKAVGAWQAASKWLSVRRVPLENQFVELPRTGQHVLASPDLPAETVRVPTAAFYQRAKMHLDQEIEGALTGQRNADAADLIGLKKALTDAIDNHPVPAVHGVWRQARQMSQGPREWDSAVALGERVLTENLKRRDFEMLWDTMSDLEKAGIARGMNLRLDNMLGRRGNADASTITDLRGFNNQSKLRTVLGDEAADRLLAKIEHEHMMGEGPLGGPDTAMKLTGQKRYQPQETWAQTVGPGDMPHTAWHAATMAVKKGVSHFQKKSIEAAQQRQNKINADIARIYTLQGPERAAVMRYLLGEPEDIGAAGMPRPVPQRPAGESEPPPHTSVPPGAPGYPQPDMTVKEATKLLKEFGYPQDTVNRMPGPTRMDQAQKLRDAYPNGPPSRTPDFPGELPLTPRPAEQPAPWQGGAPAKPLSLLEWIRKQGGISPNDPLVGDVRAMFGGKNPGGIIRQGGKSLDKLREAAIGDKYLFEIGDITGGEAKTDPRTLLFAMELEARGQKQYPLGQEGPQARRDVGREREQKAEFENSLEAQDFDMEMSRSGMTRGMIPTEIRQRAIEIMVSEGETDPHAAFGRALEEDRIAAAEAQSAAEASEGMEAPPQRGGMASVRGGSQAERERPENGPGVRIHGEDNRKKDEPLKRATGGRVDAKAIDSNPSEAQKKAGNYAKDHVRVHGLDITIENAKGSKRSGTDKGGKKWEVSMPAHYGYIKKSEGADGDHVDVYLGPHLKSSRVFVLDQLDADTRKFDEHKCFLGFGSVGQVKACYGKAFSDGRAHRRIGHIREMDVGQFKDWLANGDTTKPVKAAA